MFNFNSPQTVQPVLQPTTNWKSLLARAAAASYLPGYWRCSELPCAAWGRLCCLRLR